MLETNDDPTQYFESILFNSGTTETPYIYARINQALYIAKSNPVKALSCLDEIFYTLICDSNVVPTKIFYKINRLLVEYMNNINIYYLLYQNHAYYTPIHKEDRCKRGILKEDASCICSLKN